MSNEQNVRSYYMLGHLVRALLFHYKKIVILQLASIFLVRVFRNILIPFVKITFVCKWARIRPIVDRLN